LTQIKGNLYCTGNQNNRPARSGQPEERKKEKRKKKTKEKVEERKD
jgi:hypothetical protein